MCWEKNTNRIGTGCELEYGLNVDSERKMEGTGKKKKYGRNWEADWNTD
jgi:hypothetical protein